MTNKPALYLKKSEKKEASLDASTVITILNYFHPLSEGAIKFLGEHAYSCSFNKGELLLEEGQICEHIYFIKKGVVRGFVKDGKKDVTTWITAEGEVVSS